jgi:hypothetical protein
MRSMRHKARTPILALISNSFNCSINVLRYDNEVFIVILTRKLSFLFPVEIYILNFSGRISISVFFVYNILFHLQY